ncbi:unnamed protein product [Blepharisma stoltei]|uniref:Uncharacterized protein n=1 Tax=Blepharisma stoltei TaxID=1481888 RepID=A0AAU9J3R9_9CILI|nr:unnamed protein product [Blepharisma stoltei]
MQSTLKIGLVLFIRRFGQEAITYRKLLILCLKFLAKDKEYKPFLIKEAVECLENNIEDRATSKEILKLLPIDLDKKTLKKLKFSKSI